ncbi:MAG: DeoR/GlpR transcriptional regulator [Phycisphaeraceae bacterium]|nr:DeoR/GlpR transcriptional regulator [Phycisphaeraceae bacterium]
MNVSLHPDASPDSRRELIVDTVNRQGECSVEHLASIFDVSGMTIRRDLASLSSTGRIVRTHGGAAPASRVSFEFRFLERARRQQEQKQLIADAAGALVTDGQSLLLDSGTTTLAVARQLKRKRGLTVITTSLPIASELFGCESVHLLLLGGFLRLDSPDLTGPLTEQNLETLHADVAFIGADAIDDTGNVYNRSAEQGPMLSRMAAAADKRYIVADHTKLAQRALIRFGHLKDWHGLITDRGAPAPTVARLRKAGVHVILA